jgi:hypothetical protein
MESIKYCIYTLNEETGNYDLDLVFNDKETADQVLSDMKDNLTYHSIPHYIPEFGLPKYILTEE